MLRTLHTHYKDREITVTNHWFKGAHLFIDGELVVQDTRLVHIDRDVPFITHDLTTADGIETLRVFIDAVWSIKLAVTIDDVLIATTHPESVSA